MNPVLDYLDSEVNALEIFSLPVDAQASRLARVLVASDGTPAFVFSDGVQAERGAEELESRGHITAIVHTHDDVDRLLVRLVGLTDPEEALPLK